jgi:large subunit ribosomal protein L10
VGIAFGYDEMNIPAKALADYIKATKSTLVIKSGFMGDRVLNAKEVEKLATLPSREVLISQVMAGMQSPLYGLVSVLAGPVRGLMGVLQARIEQMEG